MKEKKDRERKAGWEKKATLPPAEETLPIPHTPTATERGMQALPTSPSKEAIVRQEIKASF